MPNPWLAVLPEEYESHMGEGHASQAGPLELVFTRVVSGARPRRIAILGCGTGIGMSCLDPRVTERVVAVDLNPSFLEFASRRLRPGLAVEWIACDVLESQFPDRSFDLVHTALVLEFVDERLLAAKIARWLCPGGIWSVVLQGSVPVEARPAPSPYPSLRFVSANRHFVDPNRLVETAVSHGLELAAGYTMGLANDKSFVVLVLARELRSVMATVVPHTLLSLGDRWPGNAGHASPERRRSDAG